MKSRPDERAAPHLITSSTPASSVGGTPGWKVTTGAGLIEGARCASIDRKVGSLMPGKEADLLMLRADRIDVWPLNIASGAVVNLMGPSHVEAVFIAGKVEKWRGNLVGVDMQRVLRSMQEARDGVLRRAGFQGPARLKNPHQDGCGR